MAFGLEKSKIESIFKEAVEEERKNYLAGGRIDHKQVAIMAVAISEAITQNNARIL